MGNAVAVAWIPKIKTRFAAGFPPSVRKIEEQFRISSKSKSGQS